MTHDLMVDALTTLGHRLTEVHITGSPAAPSMPC